MTSVLFCRVIWCSLILATFDVSAVGAERLFFLNNGRVMQGCIYKPEGSGPFPTVVFNEPSVKPLPPEGTANPHPVLGKFYTSNNYALFVTGRHTPTTLPPGSPTDPEERERLAMRGHEKEIDIILSAISTLKAQSYVDPRRIYVTGYSAGAITSLLLAEQELDVQGFVIFSPAAQIWKDRPILQTALEKAVRNATAPIFLIQPQNDYGLTPSEVLGKRLSRKGGANRSKIYPPYGRDPKEANAIALTGPNIWGPDVLAFFKEVSK